MVRLGGPSNGSSAPAPADADAPAASSAPTALEEEDGRTLYEVLADQVVTMSTGEQLAMGAALQRNDWSEIPESTRALFRLAASEFLGEGGV